MDKNKTIIERLKPGIPKRGLLFVAAGMWTIAGGMLFWRGFAMLTGVQPHLVIRILLCLLAGTAFYFGLFSKISLKHVQRILNMPLDKPCFFSFFNFRSYLMMVLMISMGIVLRATGVVPVGYLSLLYITMGIPLSVSAIRFYYNGIFFRRAISNNNNI